jgi:hypothetical protein
MVPEPRIDEAVVFEDMFVAGPRMPLHLVLTDILQNFQIQLHQLTPNVIVRNSLPNIMSFTQQKEIKRGESYESLRAQFGFSAKYYELHYQQKEIKRGESYESLRAQFGCITFHPSRYGGQA